MNIQGREKKSVYQETTQTVNHETGEIVSETSTKIAKYAGEPSYLKLYIDDICALASVSESLKKTLLLLLRKLDYDGYITLSTRYRKFMCSEMGIVDGTLRNRLNSLCNKGFLISEGGNEYLANPNYFAKGEWKNIVEQRHAFEMKIRYSENGKEVITQPI